MAGVPNIFGNATTSIPLSQLDANFNTPVTIGSTTVGLGNTVTSLVGLSNVTTTNAIATNLTLGGTQNQQLGQGNASTMKNRIINGAMVIDQRNGGASITANDATFAVDRWKLNASQASKMTSQQNQGSVTPPVGFANYVGYTSSSAYSISSGDYFWIQQPVEGYNIADLGWGTAQAKTITLSFCVYSSLTGTFGGSVTNGAHNRSYPFTYTISSANTWTSISITIAGDTTGTWSTTNSTGIQLNFGVGVGSTYSGTAGAWAGAYYLSATGATSVVGTNGATFYITGVQLEVGSSATGFEYRQYQQELALCLRYYQILMQGAAKNSKAGCVKTANNTIAIPVPFATIMRSAPTINAPTVTNLRVNGAFADANLTSGTTVAVDIAPDSALITIGTPAASGWTFTPGNGLYVNTATGLSATTIVLDASAEL